MILYDAEWDGEFYELQADTLEEAKNLMDEIFLNSFEDQDLISGKDYCGTCALLKQDYTDCDPVTIDETAYDMYFEAYHGDYKEHRLY